MARASDGGNLMSADETPDPRTVVIIGGVVYDGEEGL